MLCACRGFEDVNIMLVFQAIVASTAAVKAAEVAECAAATAAGDASLPADPASTLTERLRSLGTLPLKVREAAPECFRV